MISMTHDFACPFCSYVAGAGAPYLGEHIETAHQAELRFLYSRCETCFYAIYSEEAEGEFRTLPPRERLSVISGELTDHLAKVGGGVQHLLELSLEPTR
jgi:hypothetical protein